MSRTSRRWAAIEPLGRSDRMNKTLRVSVQMERNGDAYTGEGLVKPKRQSSSLGCVRPRFPRTPRVLWGNLSAYARNSTQTRTNAISLSAQHPNLETRIKITHEFADNPTNSGPYEPRLSRSNALPFVSILFTYLRRDPGWFHAPSSRSRLARPIQFTRSNLHSHSWTNSALLKANRQQRKPFCESFVDGFTNCYFSGQHVLRVLFMNNKFSK